MIAKLTGLIDTIGDTFLILDVSGVGYLVSCSSRTLSLAGVTGEKVTLFIETVMRAESLQLYGFNSREEQDCFRLLITIQGVGMRMSLALLSTLSPSEIYQAIASQDKLTLTRADGVGPKLASRIVTELKDKVPAELGLAASIYSFPSSLSPMVEEAVSALVNLGYRRIEAVSAVSKAHQHIGENAILNDLIRQGLSLLSRSGS
ncbi:MAG: Holliday junction branch migration protein RuvA [Alphaproteobacteria bacterium]|nr:Holliday junction branch migration protein RuvA [Alphaproteobacteria bacterium]